MNRSENVTVTNVVNIKCLCAKIFENWQELYNCLGKTMEEMELAAVELYQNTEIM